MKIRKSALFHRKELRKNYPKMKLKNRIFFFVLLLIVVACGRAQFARFYVLQYKPLPITQPKITKPFPYNIVVDEFQINRTYDNSRVVVRNSAHEIYYDQFSLWALRPQTAITNLLVNHINSLGVCANCKQRYLDLSPDYKITGTIEKIEKYENALINRADLQIQIRLIDLKTDAVIIEKTLSSYTKLYTDNMSYFAKVVSDNLNSEFDSFIHDMLTYFQAKEKTE